VCRTVGDDAARVAPLVQELLQHPAVAVLGRESRAQHLVAHRSDFANDRWVVAVPGSCVY